MNLSDCRPGEDEKNGGAKIALFDSAHTTSQINCYKIIYSYLPCNFQKWLGIYIIFLELKLCIHRLDNPAKLFDFSMQDEKIDMKAMLKELIPFCASEEQEKISTILSALSAMEQYKSIMDTMNTMKDIFPGADSPFSNLENAFDSDTLSTMMDFMKTLNL